MAKKKDLIVRFLFSLATCLVIMKYQSKTLPRRLPTQKFEEIREDLKATPVPNLRKRNIFYNRIEKCASRSLISVAANIAEANGIEVFSDNKVYKRLLEKEEVLQLKRNVTKLTPPTFYERHVFFVDFEEDDDDTRPVLINILRDPIDRFESHFNYEKYGDAGSTKRPPKANREHINECVMNELEVCNKYNSMMFNMGVYLCGMDEVCRTVGRDRVLIAKKNIDEKYDVIGMAGEFNQTLLLLEWMLPEYFKGARQVWQHHQKTGKMTASIKRDILSEEARKKLRIYLMADEYEVYLHAKKKFERLKKKYNIV